MIKDCIDCKWCKPLEDSRGHTLYFCMNAQSGCYMEETGICGWCEMDEDDDDEIWEENE